MKTQKLIGWPPHNCPTCGSSTINRHKVEKIVVWDAVIDGYLTEKIKLKCVSCDAIIQEGVDV